MRLLGKNLKYFIAMLIVVFSLSAFAPVTTTSYAKSRSKSRTSTQKKQPAAKKKPVEQKKKQPAVKKPVEQKKKQPAVKKPVEKKKEQPAAKKPVTNVKKRYTKADKKLHERLKRDGKAFTSRQAAKESWKKKNAAKYKADAKSFNGKEPAQRPGYIPQRTYIGNVYCDVIWIPGVGYGYMHPTLGRYTLWDAMVDAAFIDMMLDREIQDGNMWVGPPPVIAAWYASTAMIVVWAVVGLVVLGIIIGLMRKS